MSVVNTFARSNHLSELGDPLFVQDGRGAIAGVLSPAERRAITLLNIFGSETNSAIDLGDADADLSNVDYIDLIFNMPTAGQTGGRAKFHTDIEAALGSWSNALKAEVEYGSGGSTSGLGSAFVAEMIFGPDSDQGHACVLELEAGAPTSSVNPANTAFITANTYGATSPLAALNADIALFDINATANTGLMLQTVGNAAVFATTSIKIRLNGTVYYIPVSTSQVFADLS